MGCTDSDGAPVPCNGDDPIIRRVDVLLDTPMTPDTEWAFYVNINVPVPQITDAAGNRIQGLDANGTSYLDYQ